MGRLCGLPFCDALELERRRVARNTRNVNKRTAAEKTPIARIRSWWGMEWHELLALLHAQGLTKAECAQVMGYEGEAGLNTILWRNPAHDPWEVRRTIPAQYLVDTGETFPAAVRRLQAEGKTKSQAMVAIGYTSKSNVGFDAALKRYGLEDKFVHAFDQSRPRSEQWARRLELKAGAPRKVRQRRPKAVSDGHPHPWLAIIKREARAALDRKAAKENA